MRIRITALAGVLVAVAAIGGSLAWDAPQGNGKAIQDGDAIRQATKEFQAAFEKQDAKAIAALWTEAGEYEDDTGVVLRGRAEIEKAYADFFKDKPPSKIDVRLESLRFPSPNCAIEEGLLLTDRGGKSLPSSTLYRAFHVKENGQWRIAASREWGAGQDRIHDLDWLIGQWKSEKPEVHWSFTRNPKERTMIAFSWGKRFEEDPKSSMEIELDPQRLQLRSWHKDSDGGRGQALWIRDGDNWVLDCIGVTGDGADTESVNIIGRVGPNEITWRSIDRVINGQPVPDTVPVKLTRVTK